MTDLSVLAERWQAGDERAAEAIYHHCRDSTFGLANALLDNPADAEEAAQDALTYALTHINQYDAQRARFSTWLHTITVSRCRNRRRRHFLPSLSLFVWFQRGGDTADPAPGPEPAAMQAATQDEVWIAIQRLSPPLREAILLRHWSDHTYQEIAAILDCPLRTAQSRVRLAYQQLRGFLAPADLNYFEEERAQ
ncbi:MAG: RNA polymerase sigma factor [Chloroflexota bacterium]|nr:MAG: RNA polymerase sigma factor [Chloroflexota bacterium]